MMLLELEMNQAQQQQQLSGAALLYNAAGQPVAISLPPQPSPYQLYKSQQSIIAGAMLITAGVLSIIFNAVGMVLLEAMSYVNHGIWCGIIVSRLCCTFYAYLTSNQWKTLYWLGCPT